MKYADTFKMVTFIVKKLKAHFQWMLFNVSLVSFQCKIKHFHFKEQQKIWKQSASIM